MTQKEIDTEIAAIDAKVAEVKREIEDQESFHAEAPNHSEFFDMIHSDQIQQLEWKLDSLQLKRDQLEMMTADEFELPADEKMPEPAPNKIALFATHGLLLIPGLLIGLCFIYENSEVASGVLDIWRF